MTILRYFYLFCTIILVLIYNSYSVENSDIIPNQLHCVSEVVYKNWEKNIDWYVVEEYVDFSRQRSATKFLNVSDSREKIIYNQVNPPGKLSKRKFITYDVQEDTCDYRDFHERPLAKIRGLIIYMLSFDRLNRNLCDVVIGPSALLMAIELSLGDYSFSHRDFSPQRLIKTDTFEAIYDKDPDLVARDQSFLVAVQVPAEPKLSVMYNKTLADLGKNIQFLDVLICRVNNSDLKLRVPGTEYTCSLDEIVIKVSYHIITSFISGSLIGRELDQSSSFDFEHDPFIQSLGIGCWKDAGLMEQKRFLPPTKQFSAEYETKNGDFDASYVAFDGNINMLRLDRNDRKNIYDLDREESYHVDKFVSMEKILQEESCIVLSSSGDDRIGVYFSMENLIGVGFNKNAMSPIYLGSKTIDHITYEVYELEYDLEKFKGNFPILLETRGYNSYPNGTKYFITYFMDDYKLDLDVKGDSDYENRLLIPRYIELWAVGRNKSKKLINSLKFNAFSWSLDIEPPGDNSLGATGNLFFIDTCARERSNHVQLRLNVKENQKSKVPKRMQQAFRKRKDLIQLSLQQSISSILDISPLKMAEISMNFIHNSLDLVVDIKFIELVDYESRELLVGYVKYPEFLAEENRASILADNHNRHSLNDCKLDSVMEKTKNRVVYCKSMARCVIVEAKAFENKDLSKKPGNKKGTEDGSSADCEVYRIDWLPTFSSRDHGESLQSSIRSNLYKLTKEKQKLELEFKFRERGKAVEYAKYVGDLLAVDRLKVLESTGIAETRAILTGLRYVMNKDEGYMGVNEVIAMDSNEEDPFKYCQLACQLDEYCQSFSFCSRTKAPTAYGDCILSSLWLSRDYVNEIGKLIINEKDKEKKEFNFQASSSNEVFKLIKDESCNLHPKDFMSSFVTTASIYLNPQTTSQRLAGKKKPPQNFTPQSLEECAALSHAMSLWLYGMVANFTYCPLSTFCIVNGVPTNILDPSTGSLDEHETCHLYEKSHKQLFDTFMYSHLVLKSSSIPLINFHSMVEDNDSSHDEEVSKDSISYSWHTLTREMCARSCNMRSANCFAFDFCQRIPRSKSVCIRYSIRSPESYIDVRKGLLDNEKEFYGDSNSSTATLVATPECNHYSLKTAFADIRVKQILLGSPFTKESEKTQQFEEQVIMFDNQQIDKEQAIELSEEAEINSFISKETTGGLMRNAFLLLIGATMGCLGLLHGAQLGTFIYDKYESIRFGYSQRYREPRISQLGLTNSIGINHF